MFEIYLITSDFNNLRTVLVKYNLRYCYHIQFDAKQYILYFFHPDTNLDKKVCQKELEEYQQSINSNVKLCQTICVIHNVIIQV